MPKESEAEKASTVAEIEVEESTPNTTDQLEQKEEEEETTQNSDDFDYGEFTPGTIVLGKLKSFPPWPGIVLPNDLIPEGIQKRKPKHPTQPRSSKRKSNAASLEEQDTRLWCVRFLKDDTYMWGGLKEISLLTTEQIEKFLKDKKGKKLIKSAYEMALNPPDVEEFIIWGSNGKPIQIDNEADDADFEDDEGSNGHLDDDDDDQDDDEEEEDLEELKQSNKRSKTPIKSKGKKGRLAAKKAKTSRTATPKKEKAAAKGRPGRKKRVVTPEPEPEPEPETSSDEDWNVDDETEPPVAIDIPSSKILSDQLKRRTPLIKKARITFQDFFLEQKEFEKDPKTIKQITTTLDSLEKYTDVQISLIKHYNLHKVLIDILKRPDLESSGKEIKNFKKRIDGLVQSWFNIEVQPDESWNFVEKEEEGENDVKTENDIKEEELPAQSTETVETNGNGK